MFPYNHPLHDGYVSVAYSQSQQDLAETAVARPFPNDSSPITSYKDWLNKFTSEICGDLAYSWIGLFAPELNYSGVKPAWWPEGVTWKNPRHMLKEVKIILLDHLLRGKLLENSTRVTLELEARVIRRLQGSSEYLTTLAEILDAFQRQKKCRNVPLNETLEGGERVLPAMSIRQIIDVDPSPSGILADLSCEFHVEWQLFSPGEEPLHYVAITCCTLQDISLVPLQGPTHTLLQEFSVAQAIQADARMGILKLVVAYNKSPLPLGQLVPTLSYMAFSIRIAASLNGHLEIAIARGWEDIPGRIAEIETRYLATTVLV